ncbi:hypothetical protein [Cysteiniphilum sp. JM-1]|uniref:hypothetical protein n=1 Tax=Cysteiniphilum sp. JM-1 TaxID=2610891 RepID=UPI001247CCB3|nr:hypothetical protein [Cysteiniphilum sp. JM-1]
MSICEILCQYFSTYHSEIDFVYNSTHYDLNELFAEDGFLPRMIHSIEGNYKYVFNRKPAVNFVRKADALCLEEVSFTDDQAQNLILVMYLIDLVERWITDDKICQNNKIDLNLV